MGAKNLTADKWERAWESYIKAREAHRTAITRWSYGNLRRAEARIIKMAPALCRTMGIY